MGRPVVHWEFWSEDPARAASFYRNVFDWNIRHLPEMDYHLVDTGGGGGINGGIMKPQDGPWPAKVSFYIDVDNLASSLAKIVAAGGKTIVEHMEVPGMGEFALFADPDGRVLGIWKQVAKMTPPAKPKASAARATKRAPASKPAAKKVKKKPGKAAKRRR